MYYIYNGEMYSEEELIHHGILGQKWGVRRFQNDDGTLTDAGRKRLSEKKKKSKSIVFDKDGVGKTSFGNNDECIVVIENGGSKQTLDRILNDAKVEEALRKNAVNNLYDPQFGKTKTQYKKSLVCQQINVGDFYDPVGDGSKSDVTAWYGERGDAHAPGQMICYNSKTGKIVYSQWFS